VLEKIWARPTCEVNGISGGYTGKGFKTVIASQAFAKVSFRLVDKQDPDKIRAAFRAYVQSKLPADCTVEFTQHGGSPGIRLSADNPALVKTRAALTDEWGNECMIVGSGGSIPVAGDFSSFHGGIRSWARILAALSEEVAS
jgi:acetylornithine deacetylase/succinyl-diaminopimelate desuccinylase-like protein